LHIFTQYVSLFNPCLNIEIYLFDSMGRSGDGDGEDSLACANADLGLIPVEDHSLPFLQPYWGSDAENHYELHVSLHLEISMGLPFAAIARRALIAPVCSPCSEVN
jgi:hypothetical protein